MYVLNKQNSNVNKRNSSTLQRYILVDDLYIRT